MAYLEWDKRMGIGLEAIDRQHAQLVELINDIAAAAAQGAGRTELGNLVRAFCDYAQIHFRTEQALMSSTDYPEYFQHVAEHERCSSQALNFYRAYITGEDVSVQDYLAFVSAWFTEHTLGVDQTLRPYLRKRPPGQGLR